MYYIHIVKRFRAHCGFYAIENKLLLLITEKFLPIGEKLGQKGISATRAESISAARFLPGGEKRANTVCKL